VTARLGDEERALRGHGDRGIAAETADQPRAAVRLEALDAAARARDHDPARRRRRDVHRTPDGRQGFDAAVGADPPDAVGAEVGHQTIIPVNIGILAGAGSASPLETRNFYYGAGIGPYFRSSDVHLGGFLTGGYNLSASTYVEYKYQFVQDGNGSILSLGARF